ncbi:transglutaminase domain-containing protein [Psychroserpens mesophilus]|uniref:transglutaminase domain-containing protein n=1 Tax=Psychroserpens mesophilus TaxID=325473 RepID=UPI003D65861B
MKQLIIILVFICNLSYAQLSDFKTIDFTRADNIARLNANASLTNLPVLAHKLTSKLTTDVEKFRAIYTWVCHNISSDSNQHNTVARMRRKLQNDSTALMHWNHEFKKHAFQKLLTHKKTMCTGYAYLIKELSFLANLECEIVNGYARSADSNVEQLEIPNHSWNAVNLNNKWYLCDATWSSGFMILDNIFVKEYNTGYFLADPLLFSKSHIPLHKKWLLNDRLIQSEHILGPLVYGETFKHNIIPIGPEQMNVVIQKNIELNFSFKSPKVLSIEKIALIKIARNKHKILKIYDLKTENGLFQFKHLFKQKGQHDVHIKVNKDIIATYIIHVTKP